MTKGAIALLFFLFAGYSSKAQLTISGELRPRSEFRRGYRLLPDTMDRENAAFFITQRTRLNILFESTGYKTYISLQDVRTWGDQEIKKDEASTTLYQAWMDLKIADSIWIKLGRQEITFDNRRLFDFLNWNQNGIVHDAAVLKFKYKGWQLHLVNAFNQRNTDKTYYGTDYTGPDYKNLHILWINKEFGNLNLSVLGSAMGYQKTGTKNTLYLTEYFGPYANFKSDLLELEGWGFYQTGKNIAGKEVRAYYFSANVKAKLIQHVQTELGLNYFSGKDGKDTNDMRIRVIDLPYAATHGFNGGMDYFSSLPNDTKGAGLVNIYFSVLASLNDKQSVQCTYHHLSLQNNYITVPGDKPIDKYLGSEFDFVWKSKCTKEISLEAGYSLMLAGKSMEVIKGGDKDLYAHWAYIMITVKPTFFTNK